MVYSVKFKAFVLIGFVLVCLTACGPLDVKPDFLNSPSSNTFMDMLISLGNIKTLFI